MTDKQEQEENLTGEEIAAGKITMKQRRALGAAGKLWHLEVLVNIVIPGQRDDVGKWERANRTERELFELRQFIFSAGIMLPLSGGTWVIIPPRDIRTVYADKQSYFNEKG